MKDVDFAIERGFRLFSNHIENFHFYMIQLKIDKDIMADGEYQFLLRDKFGKIVYYKEIIIDSINKRIITPNSHEDPLVEDIDINGNSIYLICFQLEENSFNNFTNDIYTIQLLSNEIIHKEINIDNLRNKFSPPLKKISYLSDDYEISSYKDCVFRLHLGNENGNYQEIEKKLYRNEKFNFKSYIKEFPYIGLQCSYEDENPEIEEKHIVVGQKGMTLTSNYLYDDMLYEALLPFNTKYQKLYTNSSNQYQVLHEKDKSFSGYAYIQQESWFKAKTINEMIKFYEKKLSIGESIIFFEIDYHFIERQYRNKLTYGLGKLLSDKYVGKMHLDLEVCKNCPHKSQCMQIVPSGLSPLVFKKNILLDDYNSCSIYQLTQRLINQSKVVITQ